MAGACRCHHYSGSQGLSKPRPDDETNPWTPQKNKEMTPSELDYQAQRLQQYEEKQDIASNFFFSRWFSVLSDLDGYDLLDRLQREAM